MLSFLSMMKRFARGFWKVLKLGVVLVVTLIGLAVAIGVFPRLYADWRYNTSIYNEQDAPSAPVAIVFGAGLQRDGRASAVLRDRVATAVDLYLAGKVERILLSGDNQFPNYNEPSAMEAYALSLGVPESILVLDFAGRRTFDTCMRAHDIFGVQEALLVTQHYHLDRALLTCDALGLDVQGVAADRHTYRALQFWWVREFPATTQAMWDLFIEPPNNVVLGSLEPITFE